MNVSVNLRLRIRSPVPAVFPSPDLRLQNAARLDIILRGMKNWKRKNRVSKFRAR